ncbi:BQ5605_C001g00665 [Microbotryum silenes-dioicae]|uniref:BQ5605_C001g00665 protein n=1 Tax=Microbotryum silenes-dioicae TaxID=796604 RepID=A0A2X0P6F4_9BASI|nr:BQ5605_C001g00665 [Microbotryum silenes-dioicae]
MNALKTANDELVEKGIVTSNEKMSIHFLVDVAEENLAGGAEMTDQEIVDLGSLPKSWRRIAREKEERRKRR